MDKMVVTNTILSQLGGANNLRVMIGAKDFTTTYDGGLMFTLPAFGRPRVNKIEVNLNVKDLYDVRFWFLRRSKGKLVAKLVAEANDVYNEDLKSVVESNTGLILSMPSFVKAAA